MKYDSQLSQGLGYKSAVSYYSDLKKRFIKELRNSLINSGETLVDETIAQIEVQLSIKNSKSETTFVKQNQAVLNQIMSLFGEKIKITNDTINMSDVIQEAQKILLEEQQNVKEKEVELANQISKTLTNSLEKSGQDVKSILLQAIMETKHIGTTGEAAERFDALVSRAHSLLVLAIRNALQGNGIFKLYGKPLNTLQGFVGEDAEYENLLKIFKPGKVIIKPGGTKKDISGKQTHLDNILSFIEWSEDTFTQEVSSIKTIPTYANRKELIKQINFFGEQVKSFSLQTRSNTGDLLGKRISDNIDLYKEAQALQINNIYANIKFLGRYANILKTFGVQTLLMRTGDGRYFLDDFIREFRKEKYYLMFGYNKQSHQMTSTIVLDRPWSKKQKTASSYDNW